MVPRNVRCRPDKITLARQARSLTIREAAGRAMIAERRWSRMERNLVSPGDDDIRRISEALDFPASFFAQEDLVIDFQICGGCP